MKRGDWPGAPRRCCRPQIWPRPSRSGAACATCGANTYTTRARVRADRATHKTHTQHPALASGMAMARGSGEVREKMRGEETNQVLRTVAQTSRPLILGIMESSRIRLGTSTSSFRRCSSASSPFRHEITCPNHPLLSAPTPTLAPRRPPR
eukprot:88828-Rhodomonas_salina.2